MTLTDILQQIYFAIESENIRMTRHFTEKCEERKLNTPKIVQIIHEFRILGIVQQNKNSYKLWVEYTEDKDLNIILKIEYSGRLSLITAFLCSSMRRKR